MESDVRTPDKLIDGVNETSNDRNMWLTYLPDKKKNQASPYFCIAFDKPVAISYIRIWNYAKTPSRGVNEIDVEIDDTLAYRGFLKKYGEDSRCTTIVFSSDRSVISNSVLE